MEDFERYGDDNNLVEEPSPKKKKKTVIFRSVIASLFAVFILFFAFRMFLFEYYPKSVKDLVKTETLATALDGGSKVYTQKILVKYDDNDLTSDIKNYEDLGTFFCDHLYVCPDAGEVQISLRMNASAFDRVAEKCGVTFDNRGDLSAFSFRLVENFDETEENYQTPLKEYRIEDSFLMYRYVKLVFDGVPLDQKPKWLRLDIYVGETKYSSVAVYEDDETYSKFTEVKVK